MIKNFEELNSEELLYVKGVITKYLEDCQEESKIPYESVTKINKLLLENEKDIKRLERKIDYFNSSKENDSISFFGILCFALISGLISIKELADPMETLMIFTGGTFSSWIINSVVNNKKEEKKRNIYKDLDEIEDIKEESKILNSLKHEILGCKSYHKKLRDFSNK